MSAATGQAALPPATPAGAPPDLPPGPLPDGPRTSPGRFLALPLLLLARGGAPLLRLLARGLIAAALILGIGLGVLLWRLQQGPLSLPPVAQLLEEVAAGGGVALRLGDLALSWDGWRDGAPAPLRVQLRDLTFPDASGAVRVALPAAEATLSPSAILRGEFIPATLDLRAPSLVLTVGPDGTPSLGGAMGTEPAPGTAAPAPGTTTPEPGNAAPARSTRREDDPVTALLRELAPGKPLAALQELRISAAALRVLDPSRGLEATLEAGNLLLRRAPDEVILAEGGGMLRLGEAAGEFRFSGRAVGQPATLDFQLTLPELRPGTLAAAVPGLAPIAAIEAPLSAAVQVQHQPGGHTAITAELRAGTGGIGLPGGTRLALEGRDGPPLRLSVQLEEPELGGLLSGRALLRLGAGAAVLPDGQRVAFHAVEAALSGSTEALRLDSARIAFAAPPNATAPPPTFSASGTARASPEGWRGALDLAVDRAALADLGGYWPQGVGEGARRWMVENLTTGVAQNGRWHLEGVLPPGGADLRLDSASGTLEAEDITVHWLRPIPPIEHVSGTVRFLSPAEILIEAQGGRLRGSALQVPATTIRFTGLDQPRQVAAISGRITGPLADVVTLIRHPRLHLFDKRPLDLKEPGGQVEAQLDLTLPLLNDLPLDQLQIRVAGHVARARLADLVAGQSLERGELDLVVTAEGLQVNGTADLGPLQRARLAVEMDFRSGPPDQVVARQRIEGRADLGRLGAAGIDLGDRAGGFAGLAVQVEERRAGTSRVSVRGDLREARLNLAPLNWSKPAGAPGRAEAEIRLRGESIQGIDNILLEAPEMAVRGRAAFAPGSRAQRLEITEGRVGATRVTGTIEPPANNGDPWRIAARGPVLDLRAAAEGGFGGSGDRDNGRSTPLTVDVAFDRILLKAGALDAVQFAGSLDGRGAVRSLRALGRNAGGASSFEALVTPRPAGRSLRVRADDLGALLRAAGVVEELAGGRLSVDGAWRGNGVDAPLLGVAEMEEFSVAGAPAIAKVLQALSIYGIPDALRGPGLHFARLHAPFALTRDALGLDGVRAYSASLGLTVQGRILRARELLELEGTIVPSYFLNSLPGRIPLLGRLFSPERGGGLFAATFRATGPIADPSVSVNPLAALTPGALRELFGAIEGPPQAR
ncbi:DUF3971 domain-containing protein [Roseomonas sp. BN140053]|uniref:YhdP family protein n=1 Tax=Roseomonas sp. BN140053 TaxID=3391898 RepID=UPI0039E981A6